MTLLDTRFLGTGIRVPFVTDPATGDLATVSGADNVYLCIINIITTRVGERVRNEDFGLLIPDLLFENQNGIVDVLPFRLKEAIERWEPRVMEVKARAEPDGENIVRASVSWILRATGREDNLVWPYYLSGRREE